MNEEPTPISTTDPDPDELESGEGLWPRLLAWLRTWKGVTAIVVCVIVVAAGLNARAIYGRAKVWRSTRLIAQSEEAGGRGDEGQQLRLLREAMVLTPSAPVTLRAAAKLSEKRGEPAVWAFYERLLATGQATTEDRIHACRAAFLTGKANEGRRLLEELRADKGTRELPTVLALEAQRLASDNSWEEATSLARQAAEAPGDRALEQLVLASLLLRSGERAEESQRTTQWTEALDLLSRVALRADDVAIQALTTLVTLARQPATAPLFAGRDSGAWVEAAERNLAANARLKITAWDLHLAARPAESASICDAFLVKWRSEELPQQLEAARWLNQHGKPDLSLELSGPHKGLSSEWLLVHLDGLAASGRWDTVLALLEAPNSESAAIPASLRALFAMRARTELHQSFDRADVWREIQISLRNETVRDQLYVAQYAEKMGERAQAVPIYRRLLDQSKGELSASQTLSPDERLTCYSGLIRSVPAAAPAAELLPLFQGLHRDFPEVEEAANDAIYLELLTERTDLQMKTELTRLLERHPEMLAYRTTLALYELRAGNPAGAAKVYDGWQIDWASAQDRFKAVRIAVLEATGQSEAAKALRGTLGGETLRPEETALLEANR